MDDPCAAKYLDGLERAGAVDPDRQQRRIVGIELASHRMAVGRILKTDTRTVGRIAIARSQCVPQPLSR